MHNPFAADVPDFSAFASVDDWLASIKMSRYAENFALAGYGSLDDVAKMTLQQVSILFIKISKKKV
jgi:ephrin-B